MLADPTQELYLSHALLHLLQTAVDPCCVAPISVHVLEQWFYELLYNLAVTRLLLKIIKLSYVAIVDIQLHRVHEDTLASQCLKGLLVVLCTQVYRCVRHS